MGPNIVRNLLFPTAVSAC